MPEMQVALCVPNVKHSLRDEDDFVLISFSVPP
jgi:hypothetical protein